MKKKLLLFVFMALFSFLNIDDVKGDAFGLEISPCQSGTYTMNVGDKVDLNVVVNYTGENILSSFEWNFVGDTTIDIQSGNDNYSRKITALKPGTASASVVYTKKDGSISAETCTIKVQEKNAFIIPTCKSGEVVLYVGEGSIDLKPLTDNPNANEWHFVGDSATRITAPFGEVSRTISGVKEGTTTVTVLNGDDSYTCNIVVRTKDEPSPSPSAKPSPSPSTVPSPSPSSSPKPSTSPSPSEPTKPVEKSTNNNLKELVVDGYSFDKNFKSSVLEYTLVIPKNVDTIKVTAKAEDSKAKIVGTGTIKVDSDNQKVKLSVTSESGAIKDYKINIIRKDFTVKLNSINVSNFKLNETFNSEKTSYTLTVPNDVTELDVSALSDNEDAVITISGNDDLVVGKNIIRIEVKNADLESESTVYTLTVTREDSEELVENEIKDNDDKDVQKEDKKDNNTVIIIGSVIFVLLSAGVVVLVVINNKKKKKNLTL